MPLVESVGSPFQVADLPFVEMDSTGKIICYWKVSATGNWSTDCASGQRYGRMLVELMERQGQPFLLQCVVRDMKLAGRQTGIEVGFFNAIAILSIKGIAIA